MASTVAHSAFSDSRGVPADTDVEPFSQSGLERGYAADTEDGEENHRQSGGMERQDNGGMVMDEDECFSDGVVWGDSESERDDYVSQFREKWRMADTIGRSNLPIELAVEMDWENQEWRQNNRAGWGTATDWWVTGRIAPPRSPPQWEVKNNWDDSDSASGEGPTVVANQVETILLKHVSYEFVRYLVRWPGRTEWEEFTNGVTDRFWIVLEKEEMGWGGGIYRVLETGKESLRLGELVELRPFREETSEIRRESAMDGGRVDIYPRAMFYLEVIEGTGERNWWVWPLGERGWRLWECEDEWRNGITPELGCVLGQVRVGPGGSEFTPNRREMRDQATSCEDLPGVQEEVVAPVPTTSVGEEIAAEVENRTEVPLIDLDVEIKIELDPFGFANLQVIPHEPSPFHWREWLDNLDWDLGSENSDAALWSVTAAGNHMIWVAHHRRPTPVGYFLQPVPSDGAGNWEWNPNYPRRNREVGLVKVEELGMAVGSNPIWIRIPSGEILANRAGEVNNHWLQFWRDQWNYWATMCRWYPRRIRWGSPVAVNRDLYKAIATLDRYLLIFLEEQPWVGGLEDPLTL